MPPAHQAHNCSPIVLPLSHRCHAALPTRSMAVKISSCQYGTYKQQRCGHPCTAQLNSAPEGEQAAARRQLPRRRRLRCGVAAQPLRQLRQPRRDRLIRGQLCTRAGIGVGVAALQTRSYSQLRSPTGRGAALVSLSDCVGAQVSAGRSHSWMPSRARRAECDASDTLA